MLIYVCMECCKALNIKTGYTSKFLSFAFPHEAEEATHTLFLRKSLQVNLHVCDRGCKFYILWK